MAPFDLLFTCLHVPLKEYGDRGTQVGHYTLLFFMGRKENGINFTKELSNIYMRSHLTRREMSGVRHF